MKAKTLQLLTCPAHNGDGELLLQDEQWVEGEIFSGVLCCQRCGRSYPILHGIPSFVQERQVANAAEIAFRDDVALTHAQRSYDQVVSFFKQHHDLASAVYRRRKLIPRRESSLLILDIGVGWGIAWLECPVQCDVVGIDFSMDSLRLMQKHADRGLHTYELIHASLDALPFKTNRFDVVWSTQVYQHIRDAQVRAASYQRVAQLLRQQGIFVNETLNLHEFQWHGLRAHRAVLQLSRRLWDLKDAPASKVEADRDEFYLQRFSAPAFAAELKDHFENVMVRASETFWRPNVQCTGTRAALVAALDWYTSLLPLSKLFSRQLTAVASRPIRQA